MSFARPQRHRVDGNQADLIEAWKRLGGVWVPYASKPFDGWIWHSRWDRYWPVEIKDPKREGHRNEYTDRQKEVMKKLKDAGARWIVWRDIEDPARTLMREEGVL